MKNTNCYKLIKWLFNNLIIRIYRYHRNHKRYLNNYIKNKLFVHNLQLYLRNQLCKIIIINVGFPNLLNKKLSLPKKPINTGLVNLNHGLYFQEDKQLLQFCWFLNYKNLLIRN